MMWLKRLFAHKHKFRVIDWDYSLGSNIGEIHGAPVYRFQHKDLYQCKCGQKKVVVEWANI